MKLIVVDSALLIQKFLQLPVNIYKNDKNYIRPLDEDIESIFHDKTNKFYKKDNCIRWILTDSSGKTIGRIAAFINELTAYNYDQPTGNIGFFECINDQKSAFILFDASRKWLLDKGMQAMDGPVNLGSREKWWGLLVDGFYPPSYCCNYNLPAYQSFFENYGFKVFFKQYTYLRSVMERLNKVYYAVAERIFRNPDYHFKTVDKAHLNTFIADFRTIYNNAWVNHEGIGEMTNQEADHLIRSLKPVMDEKIAWFAYYKNEPIGFFLSIPELNQLFVKYAKGKLSFTVKMHLLYNKWMGNCKTMYGLVFGVIPQHQKKGVEIAMIVAASESLLKRKVYEQVQMNWIGDFNPRMMHVAEQIGAKIYKTHYTYRFLFDRDAEFKRHPLI
ncbi:hypothetical protein [Arcticibacter eurypsychrophilus]|uniref:hypothetical protein n=1 Tax=Arcticibacter eurypsychrophilus TaxID=1434752 RepID=UPI00084D9644|nr:hypothetical protein [Arcticibacter eurypsychrophilus]